ncbi:hypothetical protein [Teichococcus aestuarii]|uniref:hypothetical protein n=1 Tax=Teichococcus aestuarii TaxID=568898 RepID=UPI00361B9EBE
MSESLSGGAMGSVEDADFLLSTRGAGHELGAWVVSAAFGRDGQGAAFGLGDGTLHGRPGAAGRPLAEAGGA